MGCKLAIWWFREKMSLVLGFTATANEPVTLGARNPAQNYILNIPTRLPDP